MSFRFRTVLARLWREERGAVAVAAAVLLTGLVGLTGAATDLGVVYSARGQLQNAADSAALAAAKSMFTYNEQTYAIITTPEEARATAHQFSQANKALGNSLILLDPDYTIGWWDLDAQAFTRTGESANPDDLNAVEVTLRKDDLANSPVTTMFAGIVGVSTVDVQAKSLAFVGYPQAVPRGGGVGIPIAIKESAISNGDSPYCGSSLEFHSENNENGSWTSFNRWPANSNTVDNFICDCYTVPFLEIGDTINIVNGNLSNFVFAHLQDRFEREGIDTDGDGDADEWTVILPVVPDEANSGAAEVRGFATFTINEVRMAPHKDVRGTIKCGTIIPTADTGGPNFGARASNPKLVAAN